MHTRIRRPRLDEALQFALSAAPLTLVQAPLGAGKTAALRALVTPRSDAAWIDARPWHRGAFAGALVDAARTVRPDFGRMTLGAIAAGADAAHLSVTLAEELTHVDAPLTIVVDDVHVVAGDAWFSAFGSGVLCLLPPQVRVVLSGRVLPELALGELRARGAVAEIDPALFTFEPADVEAFARANGSPVAARDAARIAGETGGWAAGVVFALASAASPGRAAADRSGAAAYVREALLPQMDPGVLRFVEETSVFEVLDERVLACVPQFFEPGEWFARLRRGGAPVSDAGAGRVAVNPVLRAVAQERLAQRGGTTAAHAAAAEAYACAGEPFAALYHAVEAQNAAVAARFLRAYAEAVVATGVLERVRALAAAIDAEGPDADVRWHVEGLVQKARGDSSARITFERAAQASDRSGDAAIGFDARAQIVEYDLGRLRAVDTAALSDLRKRARGLGPRAEAHVTMLRGWAAAIGYDFAAACRAIEPLVRLGDGAARFNAGILFAYAQTALGECDAAEATLDGLVRLFEDDDRVVFQTLTLIWFARLALCWGRTNVAGDAADAAERLSRAADLRANEAALHVALSEIATHRGDVARIVAHAERARRRAGQAWYVADVARVRAFADLALARAAFIGHDNAIARDLAVRGGAQPGVPGPLRALLASEAAVYTLLCEPEGAPAAIERARAALSEARAVDVSDAVAIASADDVLAFLDAANGLPHVDARAAYAPFDGLIDQRRGLVTLEHAGLAAGNARRGTGSSDAFDAALAALTAQGPRFEARLVRAYASRFLASSRPPAAAPRAGFELTPREKEILALLVDGLTNKEIAQRLIVSPRTVETHVERVLGKLEVGSRSRAIAKAIRLGIVDFDAAATP